MKRNQLRRKLLETSGQVFTVTFTKRTTGEKRTMNCRLGVRKHLKGGELAYDAEQHNLLTVFDMSRGGYRSIPLDAAESATIAGEFHKVE